MRTVLIYEDDVHGMIMKQIFSYINQDIKLCGNPIKTAGKSRIDKNLERYAMASQKKRVIILRDLDMDAVCAPTLKDELLQNVEETIRTSRNFVFRIAVREAEAWLIADKSYCSEFFRISSSKINRLNPDTIEKPKTKLLTLIEGGGLSRSKKGLYLKKDNHGAIAQSSTYNSAMKEYIKKWSIDRAMSQSASLRKAINAINGSFV